MNDKVFYNLSNDEVIKSFNSNLKIGLSTEQVETNTKQYGLNILKEKKKSGLFSKFIAQFSNFLVLILIGASFVSFNIGAKKDAIIILSIVFINAVLGLYQEGKAEKSLESLQKMSSSKAKVIRNSIFLTISAEELVPGDIITLETGDIVPADIRLINSSNLKIEESSLTGESIPVEKESNLILDKDIDLGDRKNMAYMGTIVSYGRSEGIVVSTGHDTEIGKIATMIQSYEDELTPLQMQLNKLGKILGIATLIICFIVLGIGLFQGKPLMEMFMTSISLAVAAIPEGLPAIVTIVLSIGMNNMVKKNAIVKKLLAVETLGAVTVICSDKTGTLTENQMTVTKIYTDKKVISVTGNGYKPKGDFMIDDEKISLDNVGNLETLLSACVLTNDSTLVEKEGSFSIIGDPTEGALITLGAKSHLPKDLMNENYPRIKEIPFDSTRKMMTTFHKNYIENAIISFTKGAPDIVIENCTKISTGDKVLEFTEDRKKEVLKQVTEFSRKALRVLAIAYRTYSSLPEDVSSNKNENSLVFIGLVGMIDPARKEAKQSIAKCKQAGIRTVMITGDYKDTAFAIAKDLGIAEISHEAILGKKIDTLSQEELQELVKHVSVYSRVSPEHKVKIIDALKANKEVTSMTGDGVNDALALKRADIGVAMGITGTDVAKNTADVILTDDNFSTIVSAVEEGRIIYSNIKKFVSFLLSCNIGEILLVLSSILMGLPIPLLPIQLLWLNLITDSFPALALGVEKGEPDIMNLPPRDPDSQILEKKDLMRVIIQSIALATASLISFKYGLIKYPNSLFKARTIVFTTLILGELLRAYSSRSEYFSIFKIGVFSNKKMVLSTSFSLGLLLLVLYIPTLRPIFNTFPIGFDDWKIIIVLAFIPFAIGEISKLFIKRKSF